MKNFFGKHKKLCIIIAIILVLAIVATVVLSGLRKKANISFTTTYQEATVSKRTIDRSITGTGSLQPANSYTVSSRYSGEISGDYVEEGDTVSKGQELYVIDSSDSDSDDAKLITAPISGYIKSLSVKTGDSVKNGQVVVEIVDDSQMMLVLQFSTADASNINAGDKATIVLDSTFEEIVGYVESVSLLTEINSDNIRYREVSIIVDNPGALDSSYLATATINGLSSISPEYFEYISTESVSAETSGTVSKIYAQAGSHVNKGALIVALSGSDSTMHTVTSPIDGNIVDKNLKQGENVESGKSLCTIYDLSYLTMSLSVDELDIADVSVGQEVVITADAREGSTFKGYISKVSIAGSNMNGTATYPVTIRIDDYGDLLPSMSADAVIYITQAEDTLAVPNLAINRGNTVMLTSDSPTAKALIEKGSTADENGYVTTTVVLGISDDDYTQVISGLEEGDTVVYLKTESSFGNMGNFNFPGGSGNMPSGGFSGGGSMPSGGGPSGGGPSGGGSRGGF